MKDRAGKSIGAYRFGDWEEYKKQNVLSKTAGRTLLSNKLKQALIEKYGSICFLYNEEYPEQQLQVDHRIPYEILGEQDEGYIDNFMLLCPSGNRTKSWACEHCSNWEPKNPNICERCYYAHPENYLHIAGEEERRIDITFKNKDLDIYEYLKKKSENEKTTIQEAFKNYFRNK